MNFCGVPFVTCAHRRLAENEFSEILIPGSLHRRERIIVISEQIKWVNKASTLNCILFPFLCYFKNVYILSIYLSSSSIHHLCIFYFSNCWETLIISNPYIGDCLIKYFFQYINGPRMSSVHLFISYWVHLLRAVSKYDSLLE